MDDIRAKIYGMLKELITACVENSGDVNTCVDDQQFVDYTIKITNNLGIQNTGDLNKIIEELKNHYKLYVAVKENLTKEATKQQIEQVILDKKEKYITEILNKYYTEWILEGEEENKNNVNVPYFISSNKKTGEIKVSELKDPKDKETILQKIKDAIDKQEKNRSKYDFQLYFLKNEKDKDKDKEEENDSLYLSGKSFPGVYRSIYNELKSTNPSKTALDLMKVFGIGIDCSCFVSRALATIFENLKQDQPIQLQCLGDSETKGRLRTNMQHYIGKYHYYLSDKDEKTTYIPTLAACSEASFVKPLYMRPGDFIHCNGHVKIISQVKSRKETEDSYEVVYETMESASVDKIGVTKKELVIKCKKEKINDMKTFTISGSKYAAVRVRLIKEFYSGEDKEHYCTHSFNYYLRYKKEKSGKPEPGLKLNIEKRFPLIEI